MKVFSLRFLHLITLVMFGLTKTFGQKAPEAALACWQNGDIALAHELVMKFLADHPENNKAKFLLMKTFYVQGQYEKSITTFQSIDKKFSAYRECVELAAEAYVHLKKYEEALALTEKNALFSLELRKEWRTKPFGIYADKIYTIPFTDDLFEMNNYKISPEFWPGIKGSINGNSCDLKLDTGGDFLFMGKEAAKKLNLTLLHKSKTLHNISMVNSWFATADELTFENGPRFINVPVTVLETLGNVIIMGTNILEQFLTTVDYPHKQFILSPRNNAELTQAHYHMLPKKQIQLPFFLWDTHYMMAKGKFATHDNLTLFFDSGLVYLTEKDGKEIQASFYASRETLLKWGFDKSQFMQSNFIFTDYPLEVAQLSQPNTVLWYDQNLKKDRNFGGIRIDGLISHAWLKHYSWTIDFERMHFTFGIP